MKVGDLAKVTCQEKEFLGVIAEIRKERELFSEKYSIMETVTYISIACEDGVPVFDLDEIILEILDEKENRATE